MKKLRKILGHRKLRERCFARDERLGDLNRRERLIHMTLGDDGRKPGLAQIFTKRAHQTPKVLFVVLSVQVRPNAVVEALEPNEARNLGLTPRVPREDRSQLRRIENLLGLLDEGIVEGVLRQLGGSQLIGSQGHTAGRLPVDAQICPALHHLEQKNVVRNAVAKILPEHQLGAVQALRTTGAKAGLERTIRLQECQCLFRNEGALKLQHRHVAPRRQKLRSQMPLGRDLREPQRHRHLTVPIVAPPMGDAVPVVIADARKHAVGEVEASHRART